MILNAKVKDTIEFDELINSLLTLFKLKAQNGYMPNILSGKEIYEYFNFKFQGVSDDYFFTRVCYYVRQDYCSPLLVVVHYTHPGRDVISPKWISQLRREYRLEFILND